jgi:hypothetical protein
MMDKNHQNSLDQFKEAVKAFNAITEEAYYGYNLKIVMAMNPDLTEAIAKLAEKAKAARSCVIKINVARDFSRTPGVRYEADGDFSGEAFRKEKLEPLFEDPNDDSKIVIELDGAEGYATAFLEEAFGGLARKYGTERCLKRLSFVSEQDKLLVEEILALLQDLWLATRSTNNTSIRTHHE